MSTNFLYAQSPNRTGNVSKHTPKHEAVSGGTSKLSTPSGSQGAAKAGGNVYPVGNKVSLSKPKGYCGTIENDGYLKNSSYLK